jgi:hypothetical protein
MRDTSKGNTVPFPFSDVKNSFFVSQAGLTLEGKK